MQIRLHQEPMYRKTSCRRQTHYLSVSPPPNCRFCLQPMRKPQQHHGSLSLQIPCRKGSEPLSGKESRQDRYSVRPMAIGLGVSSMQPRISSMLWLRQFVCSPLHSLHCGHSTIFRWQYQWERLSGNQCRD